MGEKASSQYIGEHRTKPAAVAIAAAVVPTDGVLIKSRAMAMPTRGAIATPTPTRATLQTRFAPFYIKDQQRNTDKCQQKWDAVEAQSSWCPLQGPAPAIIVRQLLSDRPGQTQPGSGRLALNTAGARYDWCYWRCCLYKNTFI